MTRRISGLALLAPLLLAALPATAQTVGVNAVVINDVRMSTDANRTLHKAVVKERVSLNNDIHTGRSSRLQVLLLDRTTFTVGANARIKVDRFVYDPARRASSVGLNVSRGAFRFMSGKPTKANPGQSGIRTPVASIGIRGTIVEGVVGPDAVRIVHAFTDLTGFSADPDTASLVLLRGPGEGVPGEDPGAIDVTAAGTTVSLEEAGMAAFVPGEGQPPIVFRLTQRARNALLDLLRNPQHAMQQSEFPIPANPENGSGSGSGNPARQVPVRNPQAGGQNLPPGQDPIRPPGQGSPGQGGADPLPQIPATLPPRI